MDGNIFSTVNGGTPPYYYHWSNGSPSSYIVNLSQGNYYLTVTDSKGCKAYADTFIYEPNKLFVDIPDTIFMCKDSSATIIASATGGTFPYTYLWNTGQTQQTITVSPQQNTIYYITVTDSRQCQASDNILVYIYPPLQLTYFTSKDSICPGELFSIYPSVSGGNNAQYTFYIDQQPVTIPIHLYPSFSREYELMVKDACNYVAITHVPVHVYPLPTINPSSNIISGCEPLTVFFNESSPDTNSTYIWDFGDGESAYVKNPIHTFESAGTYTITLTVINEYQCKVSNIYPNWITVYPRPHASFINDPLRTNIIKPTFSFTNLSTLTDSVQWYFGDGDSSNIFNPYHTYPSQPGTYNVILIVYSDKRCVDTAYGKIYVEDVFTLYAPTAFSPDDDGLNDVFRLYGHGIDNSTFTLVIYDRWGEIIWESNNIEKGWDGKVKNNNLAPPGTYTWLAKFRDFNGILHEKSGAVTIIR